MMNCSIQEDHRITFEELESKLKTNILQGLDAKESERKL